MSLNDDFLTAEEKAARAAIASTTELFAKEFGEMPISVGQHVGDDSSPEKFFVNPNPNELPILLDDLKLINSLESELDNLNDIRQMLIANGAIDRATAASMESFVPNLFVRRPLNSFSSHLSITNFTISLEEIDKKRLGIYAGLTAALMAIVWKLYKWLFGKSGSGSGDTGSSSIASGEAVEARTETVIDAVQTAPVVEEMATVIAERHREQSEVIKSRKKLDSEIKNLLDNSTEGKTIGFLGKSSEIQEIYRLIITGAAWNYKEIIHRLELLLDHIKAASDAIDNPSNPEFTRVIDAMRATGDFREQSRGAEEKRLVTGGAVGLNALVPAIPYRNPMMQVGKNVPQYVLRSGIIFHQKFIDIGSVSYFFKDQGGLRSMIEAHDVHSRELGQIYDDIKRLADSQIVKEYISSSKEIERELEGTLPAIEKATKAADEYMKRLPKSSASNLKAATPGIYNRDPVYRDDMAATTHVDAVGDNVVPDVAPENQEPPVHGEGKASVQPDGSTKDPVVPFDNGTGDSTRYNARFANHDLIFRFLEHELRGKVREVTDWGSVLGLIARDISIINLRLTSKLMSSQTASLAEVRRAITGTDDKGAQKDFVAEMDGKLLAIMEMIIQKTKSSNVTLAEKPRKLWSIQGMLDKIVKPVSQFLGMGRDDHEKFKDALNTYAKALSDMADIFDREFDSETAARLRAMAKSTEYTE